MPRHLPEEAKEVWKSVVPGLERAVALRKVDLFSLEALCVQVAVARAAAKDLERHGLMTTGSRGQPVENPAAEVMREAQKEIRAWAERFSLDVRSRARLGLEVAPEKETNHRR